ncbi:MAG: hypothetical protein JSR80_01035 [Verrucomicrobia bacterium]|nr:hypothetical protein [Verrucomicrobiota bacterium]
MLKGITVFPTSWFDQLKSEKLLLLLDFLPTLKFLLLQGMKKDVVVDADFDDLKGVRLC